ncbi:MAG TPA: hypothetical protein VEZ14_01220 [Dehalococcoidia bacterium]|nr:hypothetical protein [Dehalococcoidia bacterium]
MPKQNRPLVRDGRIQARKKRTDRSYLGTAAAPPAPDAEVAAEDDARDAADVVRAAVDASEAVIPAGPAPLSTAPAATAPPAPPAAGKLPTTVRAIQQQGVRKRREFNVQALARRDSEYALHELRRIFILALMVVIALLVLTYFLR